MGLLDQTPAGLPSLSSRRLGWWNTSVVWKEIFIMSKIIKKVRGASMVEYALLLVAILLLAAGAFKALGPKVGTAAQRAGTNL